MAADGCAKEARVEDDDADADDGGACGVADVRLSSSPESDDSAGLPAGLPCCRNEGSAREDAAFGAAFGGSVTGVAAVTCCGIPSSPRKLWPLSFSL